MPRVLFEGLGERIVAAVGERLDARVPELARLLRAEGVDAFTRAYHAAVAEIVAEVECEARAELERWRVAGSA